MHNQQPLNFYYHQLYWQLLRAQYLSSVIRHLSSESNITYQYDQLNRQTSQNYTGSLGTASVAFNLDGNGNITRKTLNLNGNNFTSSMSYDNLERMTNKTDWYGNTSLYTFDPNGNRILYRDHENGILNYSYDDLNRLSQISKAGLGAASYSYNTAGLRKNIDYPNGSSVDYLYDNANRIGNIDNKQSGVIVTSHQYQYDQNGNRTQLIESNIDSSETTTYQYDNADRLSQTNYPGYISTLTLDKVGNRTGETIDDPGIGITTITYSYNNRDQLTSQTDTAGNNTSYQYDNAGNQTEINKNGIATTFTYSPRQRVSSITQGTSPSINYLYDADGFRVQKEQNGNTTRYIYDDQAMIAETNTLGNTIARYYYSDTAIFAETRNSQNAFYLQDALGTTVAITNQDGSIQARYNYDVWGNRNNQTGGSDSPWGFTGYHLDDETGLYYAKQRYYNPTTARFLREDPLEGNQQTPPSLHRYLYAYANPTVFIDPDGRESIERFFNNLANNPNPGATFFSRLFQENKKQNNIEEAKEIRIEDEKNEQMMTVAESANHEILLKRNIDIEETINRAHMSACVYQSAKNCNNIRTANIRRLNDQEYDLFNVKEKDLTRWYGFKSDVFINEDTGDLTMAIAGSDDVGDVITNVVAAILPSLQYQAGIELAINLSDRARELGVKLSFTGHSLGGAIASYASLATGREATTFNAAGLGFSHQVNAVIYEWDNYYNEDNLINAIYVQGEALSRIQDFIPGLADAFGNRVELIRGSTDGSFGQHGSGNVCRGLGSECNYDPNQ